MKYEIVYEKIYPKIIMLLNYVLAQYFEKSKMI